MEGIDPKAFEFALTRIEDGFVFEKFAQEFLSKLLSYSFVPVGGLKDRGSTGSNTRFTGRGSNAASTSSRSSKILSANCAAA